MHLPVTELDLKYLQSVSPRLWIPDFITLNKTSRTYQRLCLIDRSFPPLLLIYLSPSLLRSTRVFYHLLPVCGSWMIRCTDPESKISGQRRVERKGREISKWRPGSERRSGPDTKEALKDFKGVWGGEEDWGWGQPEYTTEVSLYTSQPVETRIDEVSVGFYYPGLVFSVRDSHSQKIRIVS